MKYMFCFSLALFLTFQSGFSHAQIVKAEVKRKITDRTMPEYPPIAHAMHLGGIVKLDAVVGPSGAATSVVVTGGAPILSVAAAIAVRKWKWMPAKSETTEFIEVTFKID